MFKKSISSIEKHAFLEYLSFQTKTGTSLKKAVERYMEGNKPPHIIDVCKHVSTLIELGTPASEALLETGLISSIEFTMLHNVAGTGSVSDVLLLAADMSKESNKSKDVIVSSSRTGVLMLLGLLMLIPLFREDIEGIYTMFAAMSSMSSGKPPEVQLPFLVKYWWSVFVVVGVIGLIAVGLKYFFSYLYREHGKIYYSIFRYKIYNDMSVIFETLLQMQQSMSDTQSYKIIAQSAPNTYWRELFEKIVFRISQGGKASEEFAQQEGLIPLNVIHCIMDGEDTGEMSSYLVKASAFCKEKYDGIQELFRTGVPVFFDLLLYLLIGIVVIKFTDDMNNLGIMNVLTQVK